MFPFSTRSFSLKTDLTVEELTARFSSEVLEPKLFAFKKDGKWYGKIDKNRGIIELGKGMYRNSFHPIVVFKWSGNNSTIKGFYRVSLLVIIILLIIPLFGLYITIKGGNIIPFLLMFGIWSFINLTFGSWLFNKDFKLTQDEFLKLIAK